MKPDTTERKHAMNISRMFRKLIPAKSASQLERTFGKSNAVPVDLSGILPRLVTPKLEETMSFTSNVFWCTSDRDAVFESAMKIRDLAAPGFHFADNMMTWGRNMSMLDDPSFVLAWQSNIENASDEAIVWRRFVLACAAYHCVHLDGDFVECGAYTGVGMKTVMDYLGGVGFPKTFWGYDVFEHDDSMLNHSMPEHGAGLYAKVQEKFAAYPQVKLIKGLIPQVFAQGCPERIAYLHIDLNQAPAEIATLEHLFDKMVPGAVLILDDYEWNEPYRSQKLAEDVWFDARGYRVMPLPTGQAILIKR
jgi:O-methyltransferase